MKILPHSTFHIPHSRKGYTIIELLVVVIITAFLASFVFSYGRGGREQVSLMVERAKVAQVILRARSLAVSTYNQPSPPCAYGVHFDYTAGTYQLASYSASPCSSIASVSGIATTRESYSLPAGTVFGSGVNPVADVLFFPPDPRTVIFTGPSTTSTDGSVYLMTAGGTGSSTVSINSVGQVTF